MMQHLCSAPKGYLLRELRVEIIRNYTSLSIIGRIKVAYPRCMRLEHFQISVWNYLLNIHTDLESQDYKKSITLTVSHYQSGKIKENQPNLIKSNPLTVRPSQSRRDIFARLKWPV